MISKNLIVIIGNGFDLAHNYDTSFNGFANYIIDEEITPIIKKIKGANEKDPLLFESFYNDYKINSMSSPTGSFIQKLAYSVNSKNNIPNTNDLLKQNSSEIKFIINNKFLGKLFNNDYQNWFDIENAYFEELLAIEDSNYSLKDKGTRAKVLNKELSEIKKMLIKYLQRIEHSKNSSIDAFFNENNFYIYNNIYIINFNYTKTIESYFIDNGSTIRINYIHGNLDNSNIVFGYGNDKHRNYQVLKDSLNDEYLRFLKTFEYLNTRNYSDIHEQILENFADYEVAILGHSLGQTDKTLIKEIIDNPQCKKIHLYKRKDLKDSTINKEEFSKLVYAASRIIQEEKDLRIKVLNYKESAFFPS